MEVIVSQEKRYTKLKGKLAYVLNDRMAMIVFILITFKTMLFMNVIQSYGASKLRFDLNALGILLGKSYLCILFSLIAISITFLFSETRHLAALVIVDLLYSVMFIGDLWYYRGFQDFLSLHQLRETQNLNNLSAAVLAMARPIDIAFVTDNIVIIALVVILRKRYKSVVKEKGAFSILFFIPVSILLLLHFALDYHGSEYNGPTLFKTQYIPYSTMETLSPIGYHFYDSLMFVKDDIPYKLSDKEKNEVESWLNYKNENLPANEYSGMFKGKNLIFIQVESLENFVINKDYKGQAITPNLNSMLKNSLYFSNFYEQVNNGNSGDADLMVNTSVLPVRRGSTFFRFPDNTYNTLGKLLQDKNYYTRSVHASDGAIWNVSNAIKNFNFNDSKDVNDFPEADKYWMGLTDESLFNEVSSFIDKDSKPFYYYTVTVTSHVPFTIPDKMKGLNLPEEFDETSPGAYLQSIHYTDEQIGNFIKDLDSKGILDDTVVVIYGDHTGIHKYYDDEVEEITDNKSWWDNGDRVPFIIYNKDLNGKQFDTIGAEIDVLPTVAYLMGIDEDKYKDTSMGRNLLNTKKSYAILNDGTIKGEENLSKEDIEHIKKSFDIADVITRSNYFKSK